MSFLLEQIDRAIEWHINDKMIALSLMPDKRAYVLANDIPGYNVAWEALQDKVKVFGVGNYKDREQLKANNIIVSRLGTPDGDVASAYPFFFDFNESTGGWTKKEGPQGSFHIEYEVRFVCMEIDLERILSQAMILLFPKRMTLKGIIDETLAETEESFTIRKPSPIVDLSADQFMEKVVRLLAEDVNLTPDTVIEEVPAATEISVFVTPNIDNVDQDPALWNTDPETGKIIAIVPQVTSTSIEIGAPADILLNYDQTVAINNQEDGLPFTVTKDGVDITNDIISIIKSTTVQLTITMNTAFVNGESVTISYEREQEIGSIVSANGTEMEKIEARTVANNL